MITSLNPNNHLFELARRGKRLPHLILAVVLCFVFVLAAQFMGVMVAVPLVLLLAVAGGEQLPLEDPPALVQLALPDSALEQAIFLILAFGPLFIILWLWLALVEKRPLWTIGLEKTGAGLKYARGLLLGLLLFAVSIGLPALFGYIAIEPDSPEPYGVAALGGVLLVFLGWVVQGSAEEALTRGWLLPVLGARYNPLLGILLSAGLFAVLHSLNPNLGPIAVLNLFLFGLFAALYAIYEGGLWGVFSLHTAWNWAQGNIFGFEVSGSPAPGGTLFNLMETGPDVITGGAFGPEGGLAVTVVLVVACAIVGWLDWKDSAKSAAASA